MKYFKCCIKAREKEKFFDIAQGRLERELDIVRFVKMTRLVHVLYQTLTSSRVRQLARMQYKRNVLTLEGNSSSDLSSSDYDAVLEEQSFFNPSSELSNIERKLIQGIVLPTEEKKRILPTQESMKFNEQKNNQISDPGTIEDFVNDRAISSQMRRGTPRKPARLMSSEMKLKSSE